MTLENLTIETMTHCEAEVVSKELQGEDSVSQVLSLLERLRHNRFQAVVWDQDNYVGGIWYNPIYKQWTAEFLDVEWRDADEAASVQAQLLQETAVRE
ncbi:hypothetical protein [Desulfohalobium retbaense]|uniref:Uncharacterized protein n=1 Tax=Desulfohalobium retbaense (strain ATCC 49708 / DSM 5692 / JCM 16813 / HR100) TaxID=485915 RepID=C8X5F6_DESRD|nr:hypothetical protein [Desulfohalobium retbaense]ACV69653.1 hypothetical protein Dret_2371 [Desulfohalobium retbaense DSM 5692]